MTVRDRVLSRPGSRVLFIISLAASGLLVAARPVSAADDVPDGPTTTGQICMQEVFGTPVTGKNQVVCTANDISLAKAAKVEPSSCTEGEIFDLLATFDVNVTANSRYDAGIYFRIDGGPNARGGDPNDDSEICSLSALDPEISDDPLVLALDKDTCGDFNAGPKTVTLLIPGVLCSDPDNDNKLNLPYCTSWHSNQGTFCSIDDGVDDDDDPETDFEPDDAAYFTPDTKSKCVCDDDFTVPVTVESASIKVVKSVAEDDADLELSEPGGDVAFTVTVTNLSKFESVTIKQLLDSVYDDLLDPDNPNEWLFDNGCLGMYNVVLKPAGDPEDSATCTFYGEVYGDAPYTHHDIVTVKGIQTGNDAEVSASDDADVHVVNTTSAPTVVKAVDGCQIVTMNVTYTVSVANSSTFEDLSLTALSDDKFGDIMNAHPADPNYGRVVETTCSPQTISKKEEGQDDTVYTCSFVGEITDVACDMTHDNVVTAETDDDGDMIETPSNTATLTLQRTMP